MSAPIEHVRLVRRVRRALAREGEFLKIARGQYAPSMGRYQVINECGFVACQTDDIEDLARQLGIGGAK
jgi:hypothetical protein